MSKFFALSRNHCRNLLLHPQRNFAARPMGLAMERETSVLTSFSREEAQNILRTAESRRRNHPKLNAMMKVGHVYERELHKLISSLQMYKVKLTESLKTRNIQQIASAMEDASLQLLSPTTTTQAAKASPLASTTPASKEDDTFSFKGLSSRSDLDSMAVGLFFSGTAEMIINSLRISHRLKLLSLIDQLHLGEYKLKSLLVFNNKDRVPLPGTKSAMTWMGNRILLIISAAFYWFVFDSAWFLSHLDIDFTWLQGLREVIVDEVKALKELAQYIISLLTK